MKIREIAIINLHFKASENAIEDEAEVDLHITKETSRKTNEVFPLSKINKSNLTITM